MILKFVTKNGGPFLSGAITPLKGPALSEKANGDVPYIPCPAKRDRRLGN